MGMASTVDQDHIYCAVKHFGVFSITTEKRYGSFLQIRQNTNFVDEASPLLCLLISLARVSTALDAEDLRQWCWKTQSCVL